MLPDANKLIQVNYWGVSNVKEQFDVQCAIPFMESHVRVCRTVNRFSLEHFTSC